MTPLRITVLGSGSVGLAIAATYAQAGQDVTLLARGAAVPALRSHGITVSGVSGDHAIEPQRIKVSDAEQPHPHEHTRQLITQLADETIQAVRAERAMALAPDGATYVESSLTPFVLPKAAAHRSSMLQDVEAGRRTEIDYLNGAVVRMGKRHGIATAANAAVANLVRAREKG